MKNCTARHFFPMYLPLLVVDVYSDWSGPCTGMISILKKIKMEIGGDALSYATVIYCQKMS